MNPFKQGDKVKYVSRYYDPKVYEVYDIYGYNAVSLGLYEYPDVEQDYQVEIKDIKLI